MGKHVCEICDSIFYVSPHREVAPIRTCDWICEKERRRRIRYKDSQRELLKTFHSDHPDFMKNENSPNFKNAQVLRICSVCGKQYKTFADRKPKHCSDECRFRSYKNNVTRVLRICILCGKQYTTTPSRRLKFCSSKCYSESR